MTTQKFDIKICEMDAPDWVQEDFSLSQSYCSVWIRPHGGTEDDWDTVPDDDWGVPPRLAQMLGCRQEEPEAVKSKIEDWEEVRSVKIDYY